MKSKAFVQENVKDGQLKQCISSIPCKFKSLERIVLYKINFILVCMWERSLIGVYCDIKLERRVLTETCITLFENLAAVITAFIIYKCSCWYYSTPAYLYQWRSESETRINSMKGSAWHTSNFV
jgi:hypothetical protein